MSGAKNSLSTYAKKALRENNDEKRNSGFKIYRSFLKRKKLLTSEKFNNELQTKKIKDPKEYWNLLKSFIRDHEKIPIAKSLLFDHFKTLNSATSPHHSNHDIPHAKPL